MNYSKKICFLLPMLCLMVLLAGCQERGSGTDGVGNNESEISQETQQNASDINTADTEETSPVDETETIYEKTAVNLVEEESESRIIVQRNIQEMEISLTVYLTDGTSATIQYPMCTEKDYAYCETAYLQYDNKESIVLEIVNGTSNYGAAEYHVLHVEKENGEFVIVEDATILDGQSLEEANDRYSSSLIEFDDYTNTSFTNEENLIVKRSGKPAVHISIFNGNTREVERYHLYYDQEWKVEDGDIGALLIKAVLLGDAQFIYVSDGKTKTIDITDIPMLFGADDVSMKIWDFAVVDLDRDGEDEVILFVVGVAGDMGGKLILHQIDGKVYGYICDNRILEELKTDGTFGFSDPKGVAEGGIGGIIDFSEFGYTMDKISYGSGTHEGWDTFIVDHEPATEEEYFDAANKQSEKPDAEWYGFTNENINAVF